MVSGIDNGSDNFPMEKKNETSHHVTSSTVWLELYDIEYFFQRP